jgi:hypothetical protein
MKNFIAALAIAIAIAIAIAVAVAIAIAGRSIGALACTTTNQVNTNCAALTDETIGNTLYGAADTAIMEWFANADTTAAEAKWGHIRDW